MGSMTQLWKNSSPNDTVAGSTTWDLSQDPRNYDQILILWKFSTTSNYMFSQIMDPHDVYGSTNTGFMYIAPVENSPRGGHRVFYLDYSETSNKYVLYVGAGNYNSSSSANTYVIPLALYGIDFL